MIMLAFDLHIREQEYLRQSVLENENKNNCETHGATIPLICTLDLFKGGA